MNDFLPENYKIPVTSNYMKFEEGENKFRVLGSAITGLEYWKTVDGKRSPVRLRPGIAVPIAELETNPQTGELEMPKHFWAFPVFNYADNRVQILEITQKTLQKAIKGYLDNSKWGDPKQYDITVTKTKDNGKTNYTIMPDPKEPVHEDILTQYKNTTINLAAVYDNKDPFMTVEEYVDVNKLADEVTSGIEKARAQAQKVRTA